MGTLVVELSTHWFCLGPSAETTSSLVAPKTRFRRLQKLVSRIRLHQDLFESSTLVTRFVPSPVGVGKNRAGKVYPQREIIYRSVVHFGHVGKNEFSSSLAAAAAGYGANVPDDGTKEIEDEARAAVANVLLECGLSENEAMTVVANSPGFLAELVREYHELEQELELLEHFNISALDKGEKLVPEETGAYKSLEEDSRARLQQLASRSNGMAPFLESLGLHLPSIARVSHSLSSQRLPDLCRKVEYIKELLILTVHDGRPLEDLMRHMMKNLSLIPDEDLQQTLSFYEKLEARRGLGALKEASYALPQLIDAFPQIFLRNLEDEIKPTVALMVEYGVTREKLGRVLLCFPPFLLKDPTMELRPRMKELKKIGVAARDYGRMIVKYPWLLSQCVADNVEETVKFLESIKVLKSKIDGVITRCPQLLGFSSTAALVPMIEHLKEFGVKSKRLGRVIALSPQILTITRQEFDEVVAFLNRYGYDSEDLGKLLRRAPEIFAANIEGTLQKKIDFLLELGIKRGKLFRIIKFYPEILSMSVENALRPRINYLRCKGFANHEISRMIFKFPPILGYNPESVLSPKLEFLTESMRRPIKDVVNYPKYFSFSLEKKIKPRAKVLANRQIECDLQTMLAKNDDQFAAEFLGFETMYLPPLK